MTETVRIPLFPLGVVLFPHSRIPLHIFEDRDKRLVEECLSNNSFFGINYVEEDKLHSIGCAAKVIEVTERHPDGELDIVTEGDRRYEVVELEQNGPDQLSYAIVNWVDDVQEARDAKLADETIELFNELTKIAYKGTIDPLDSDIWKLPDHLPSFKIAQKSGLEAPQRQALLTITSENERLSMLHNFLSQLLPKVREIETINDLIRNDGYIVTWNKKKPGNSEPYADNADEE
jgi:Lon protease-like protein